MFVPRGGKPGLPQETADFSRGLRALGRVHPLRGVSLAGVLGRSQYRLISTELDELPREEWAGVVRWRLKEQVDFPVDDAIVDVLGVSQDTQNRSTQSAIALPIRLKSVWLTNTSYAPAAGLES